MLTTTSNASRPRATHSSHEVCTWRANTAIVPVEIPATTGSGPSWRENELRASRKRLRSEQRPLYTSRSVAHSSSRDRAARRRLVMPTGLSIEALGDERRVHRGGGETLELADSPRDQLDARRVRDRVPRPVRHQQLARRGCVSDARGRVDGRAVPVALPLDRRAGVPADAHRRVPG